MEEYPSKIINSLNKTQKSKLKNGGFLRRCQNCGKVYVSERDTLSIRHQCSFCGRKEKNLKEYYGIE